jgi:outer membrane protein assembly factor BamD
MMRLLCVVKFSSKMLCTASIASALLIGCSVLPDKYDETSGWSEQKLYQEAQEALKAKSYEQAAKYSEAFEGRFPLSKLSKDALLNAAYAYHKNNEKPQATQAVERFIELYPNDDQVDYAYYLRGLIYFNDNLGLLGRFAESSYSERDPRSMKISYNAFQALVQRFPKSKYATDALDRMRFIVNSLAQHDMLIAKYYYQRGAYLAASSRAEQVIKEYDRAPAIEEALFIAYKSYAELGLDDLKNKSYATLMQNFPQTKLLKVASLAK